jgi:N-methylhydantoinase B/oxoprolinase/acetone carboxylase alpha subunit
MVDAISLEVFKHLLAGVAEEMEVTLRRSSFSANIKEGLDFSCAVFDAQGRMIAQCASWNTHCATVPAAQGIIAAAMAWGESMAFARGRPSRSTVNAAVSPRPVGGVAHLGSRAAIS